MMITKVRRLGLGLFPAEKDVNVAENDDDFHLRRDGRNGPAPGSNRISQQSQAHDFVDAESEEATRISRMSQGPGVVEAECKSVCNRSSRKSYGLELFEAALKERKEKESAAAKEDLQRREKEFAERKQEVLRRAGLIDCSQTDYVPELIHDDCISSFNKFSRNASCGPAFYETEPTKDIPRRRNDREKTTGYEKATGNENWVEEDAEELCVMPGEKYSVDEDRIKLVQKNKRFRSMQSTLRGECYLIIIPKRIMIQMPKPPNSYVSPPSFPNFYIRVLVVHMSDPSSVDSAVDWLMGDGGKDTRCIVGLKCEPGDGKELNLIQLSLHRRCVLIRLLEPDAVQRGLHSDRLAELLATHNIVKTGEHILDDAVAIYWATGLVVNCCKNVSEVHVHRQRPLPMLAIFRKLYKWEWLRRLETSKSDWGISVLSSKQLKYGIMNAWSSRMNALGGAAIVEGAIPLVSLENIPFQVLDLFGRAIADAFRTEEIAQNETSGTLTATSTPGTLQLVQHSYRSRVKGKGCVVEMQLKEDRGSVQYKVKSRKGKAVTLAPYQNTAKSAVSESPGEHAAGLALESIKSLTVLEGAQKSNNWLSKRLRDGLRSIIRDPATCPQHLLLALGCDESRCFISSQQFPTKALDLRCEPFTTISSLLNESQREAWQNILTTPLSATIGPPGTGKTSLIQCVAKSWIAGRGVEFSKEILICTAHQNVAVRHLAETLVEGEVPGVLLLISEDYYAGWHESFYTQLVECVVVSSVDQAEFRQSLSAWRTRNEGRLFPNVVVCTVDLIGCPSFATSLMSGKVTALIIDESSQSSDMSFLRPLISLPDLAMVCVLGDPHQLPPYSAARNDRNDRYDADIPSVFDLVSNGCQVNFLREQYRMPPAICEFLSAEVYDNVLMTAPHRLKERDIRPLVWSHVKGVAATVPGKTSLCNIAEASAIVRFCTTLVRTMDMACERVVVLTLYEEQTRKIADDLAANDLEIPVHNVDSFQGQQCDVVVISLVVGRSFSSFAADRRRACVMLSRVRRLLCVFGDFDEVKRNQQAGLWMRLANHCKKQNLVIDEDKVDSFLASSVDGVKDMWVPPQNKNPHVELLSNAAAEAAEVPPAGISVQVIFKAR